MSRSQLSVTWILLYVSKYIPSVHGGIGPYMFMVELVHVSNWPIFCITITRHCHYMRGRSSGLILKTISIETSTLQYDHEIK